MQREKERERLDVYIYIFFGLEISMECIGVLGKN